MFASHAFLPATSHIPLTLKIEFAFLAGKNIMTSKRKELTCPPQGDHYRNGKGTGIKGTAQCQIPIFPAIETRFFSEVAIAKRFSFRKYQKSAQA